MSIAASMLRCAHGLLSQEQPLLRDLYGARDTPVRQFWRGVTQAATDLNRVSFSGSVPSSGLACWSMRRGRVSVT
jgi:hypothetical protein